MPSEKILAHKKRLATPGGQPWGWADYLTEKIQERMGARKFQDWTWATEKKPRTIGKKTGYWPDFRRQFAKEYGFEFPWITEWEQQAWAQRMREQEKSR